MYIEHVLIPFVVLEYTMSCIFRLLKGGSNIRVS